MAKSHTCGFRAPSNGMEVPTLLSWRPALVHRRTPLVVSDLCTKQIENLQCGATQPLCCERCVQSSLPCVGRVDGRVNASGPRPGTQRYFPETLFAKEDKRRFDCGGNHLGCPKKGTNGVAVRTKWQAGPAEGNTAARSLMGNRLIGNER